MAFVLFLSFIVLLRIGELIYSKNNEKWLRKMGAVEHGREHYPYMILLHSSFLLSLLLEYVYRGYSGYSRILLVCYFILLGCKFLVLRSLGKYWNTKILRIPGGQLVTAGPYKLMKHPNYAIVICEIALIPLVFHLYVTAIVFSILNLVMLNVRIKAENKALNEP